MTRPLGLAVGAAAVAAAVVVALLPPRSLVLPATGGIPEPVRGAFHVHTRRSDGSGTVEQIAAAASRAGLKFVILTDHGDGTRSPDAPRYLYGVLCIDAVEISTSDGHIIALGLDRRTPYPLGGAAADVVEDIARFGGMSVAAHPASPRPSLRLRDWSAAFDGVEWLNGDSEWRDEPRLTLVRALITYPFRKTETMGSLLDRPAAALDHWDVLNRRRRVVALAAADAHASMGLTGRSNPYGDQSLLAVPGYEQSFRVFSIAVPGVALTGHATVDATAVTREISLGHVYSSIDGLAAPARLEFTAAGGGKTRHAGDTMAASAETILNVRTTAPPDARVDLLRDGRLVSSSQGSTALQHRAPEPGAYRVEVHLAQPGARAVPWILSNPIYIGPFESEERPGPPVIRQTAVQYGDGPIGPEWGVEKSPQAGGLVDVVPTIGGTRLLWRYALAGTAGQGPYVALIHRTRPEIASYDCVIFTAQASRPARIRVQLRGHDGPVSEDWNRSVYLDETARTIAVRFDAMRPGGATSRPHPQLSSVDTLMFVIDEVNTALGASGQIWIDDVKYGRAAE